MLSINKKQDDCLNGLKPRVIVCLDVANGRVVKGTNFVAIKDMGDPVHMALKYEQDGADEIIFLDIKATIDSKPNALAVVTRVAKNISIPFTVGGGLNSLQDARDFLNAGADKVALNSAAVNNPDLINQISAQFGSQSLVIAVDVVKNSYGEYEVVINGGMKSTNLEAFEWITEVEKRGAGEILLTAIDRDGTGSGFDNKLMHRVSQNVNIQVIASGGANRPKDFLETYRAGSDAALAAGMFHRNEFSISQVKEYLLKNNLNVRYENRNIGK